MQQNRDEGVEQAPQPTLCQNNCGFYASCSGYCSKCHKDKFSSTAQAAVTPSPALLAEAAASAAASAAAKPAAQAEAQQAAEPAQPIDSSDASATAGPSPIPTPLPSSEEASTSASPAAAAAEPAPKSGPARCSHPDCRKKVGLTGFRCKCDGLFCGSHRLAEDHSCPHDYKTQQRQKLAAQNPLVAAAKVQRI